MSGGSLGYLYCKDFEPDAGLFAYVAQKLRKLGHEAAAQESDAIAACIAEAVARRDRLADVLQAVEWYESGDWGKDDVAARVAAWEAARATETAVPASDQERATVALVAATEALTVAIRDAAPRVAEALIEYRRRRNPCP